MDIPSFDACDSLLLSLINQSNHFNSYKIGVTRCQQAISHPPSFSSQQPQLALHSLPDGSLKAEVVWVSILLFLTFSFKHVSGAVPQCRFIDVTMIFKLTFAMYPGTRVKLLPPAGDIRPYEWYRRTSPAHVDDVCRKYCGSPPAWLPS